MKTRMSDSGEGIDAGYCSISFYRRREGGMRLYKTLYMKIYSIIDEIMLEGPPPPPPPGRTFVVKTDPSFRTHEGAAKNHNPCPSHDRNRISEFSFAISMRLECSFKILPCLSFRCNALTGGVTSWTHCDTNGTCFRPSSSLKNLIFTAKALKHKEES